RLRLDHLRLEIVLLAAAPAGPPRLVRDLAYAPLRVQPQRAAPTGVADRMDTLAGADAVARQPQLLGALGHPANPDQGQVLLGVPGDDPARDTAGGLGQVEVRAAGRDQLALVVEREQERYLVRVADDVIVGHDQPLAAVDQRAGARADAVVVHEG